VGDAGNVSFSESEEYRTFAEALRNLVKRYHSQESAEPDAAADGGA
jgi:hypothetical protein